MDNGIISTFEPGVQSMRNGDDGGNTVLYHCEHEHVSCFELSQKHGVCVCGNFVFARSDCEVVTPKETWVNILTSLLEGFPSSKYWGFESSHKRKFGQWNLGDAYISVVIIRVKDSVDGDRIVDLLDLFKPKGETAGLTPYHSCCVEDFEEQFVRDEKRSQLFTFGDNLYFW